jgi:hypothetical protein
MIISPAFLQEVFHEKVQGIGAIYTLFIPPTSFDYFLRWLRRRGEQQ